MKNKEFWDFLYSLRHKGMKYEIDRIKNFLEETGRVYKNYKIFHIVGTNGKGSVASILNQLLIEHGYKTGCFRSPHLYSPLERITVDNNLIEEDFIIDWYNRYKKQIEKYSLSFFEIFTALALHYFYFTGVDWAILEAGLGGRLDATNVVSPVGLIITNISLDHERILGDTVEKIAIEKFEAIKPNVNVFLGFQSYYAQIIDILKEKIEQKKANLLDCNKIVDLNIKYFDLNGTLFDLQIDNEKFDDLFIKLAGEYQVYNAAVAISAFINNINNYSYDNIKKALHNIIWRGRLERISNDPEIFVDVSHNIDGIEKTFNFLKKIDFEKVPVIFFSILRRKKFDKIFQFLERTGFEIILIPMEYYEGFSLSELQNLKEEYKIPFEIQEFSVDLINKYKNRTIFIMGSHYLLEEIVPKIKKRLFK